MTPTDKHFKNKFEIIINVNRIYTVTVMKGEKKINEFVFISKY